MPELINQQLSIPESLRGILIDAYYTSYRSSGIPFSDKHIPQSFASWVVHFKDTFYINLSKEERQILPHSFFTGFFKNYIELVSIQDIESFVFFIKPYGLYRLFGTDMKLLSRNFFMDSSVYINSNVLKNAYVKEKNEDKICYLFDFLEQQLQNSKIGTHVVDFIYDEIIAHNGIVKIGDLCDEFKISERYLRRNFETRIGISAKQVSKIARINYLIHNLPVKSKANWYDLVYNCGYTDQSHLINDFKSVTGETPRRFFTRDRRYVNLISFMDDKDWIFKN